MGGAIDVVNKGGNGRWGKTDVSVSKQVNEMNNENRDDVKWQEKGLHIIPKSLNVVRMTKSNFQRGFKFDRIFQVVSTSSFNRYTALYTKDFVFSVNFTHFIKFIFYKFFSFLLF